MSNNIIKIHLITSLTCFQNSSETSKSNVVKSGIFKTSPRNETRSTRSSKSYPYSVCLPSLLTHSPQVQYDKIKRKALLGANVGGPAINLEGAILDTSLNDQRQRTGPRPASVQAGRGNADIGAIIGGMEATGVSSGFSLHSRHDSCQHRFNAPPSPYALIQTSRAEAPGMPPRIKTATGRLSSDNNSTLQQTGPSSLAPSPSGLIAPKKSRI